MEPIRVVAAAIVREGRVFCARRGPDMRHPGRWELPGGKVEPGEGDAEALRRELTEELGVRVAVGAFLAESLHAYPRATVHLVAYACAIEGDQEPELTEHDDARWLAPEQLSDVTWADADVPLLPAVRAALSSR
jgi:8-oxo-dGTP diphosphatase